MRGVSLHKENLRVVFLTVLWTDCYGECSLSRREECSKHQLSACLLYVCPLFTDSSENNVRTKGIVCPKTWAKVIRGAESESEVGLIN